MRDQSRPRTSNKTHHKIGLMISLSILNASSNGYIDEVTKLIAKTNNFLTFHFFVVMLLGRLVVRFGVDFSSIFGPKIDQNSIKN